MGVKPECGFLRPMVPPISKVLPAFISDYTAKIKGLGRIPKEKRTALLEKAGAR